MMLCGTCLLKLAPTVLMFRPSRVPIPLPNYLWVVGPAKLIKFTLVR